MTTFVEKDGPMEAHKNRQAFSTVHQVLAKFPGAEVTYTFIAPAEPDQGTKELIQKVIIGLPTADQKRLKVKWRAIGYTR